MDAWLPLVTVTLVLTACCTASCLVGYVLGWQRGLYRRPLFGAGPVVHRTPEPRAASGATPPEVAASAAKARTTIRPRAEIEAGLREEYPGATRAQVEQAAQEIEQAARGILGS